MYIQREADQDLAEWKKNPGRKPLLIRGARQTGKTTSVRKLGESFDSFVELNFDANPALAELFAGAYDIPEILSKIEVIAGRRIEPGRTLLFFDEVQACPRAISALRYFYEQVPDLHVIATGSLLEFVFGDLHDFGVGRIRNLFFHPLSFAEFLRALGDELLWERALGATPARPIEAAFHTRLLERLRSFLVVGGLPAAVGAYVKTGRFMEAQREQDDILVSLKADFGKYKKRVPPERIQAVLSAVVRQTGEKFVYSDPAAGLGTVQAKDAVGLLEQARLVLRVQASHASGVPLGGDVNPKSAKLLLFDTGLYLRESGLDLSEWMSDPPEKFANRGKLAEMFVGLEIKKSAGAAADAGLFYWHREARGSNAEVDYLVQKGGRIVPVEVKSGRKGAMRSLGILMKEKDLPLGLRFSQENLSEYGRVRTLPLYLAGVWPRFA